MTYKDQEQNIGKEAIVFAGGMRVMVKVLDFKQSYGRERWLITPISGSGEVWVENISFTE